MKVIDAIAEILKRESVEFMACYPTTPIINAVAAVGIRPIVCRQERVGAGIADGYSRIKNGKRIGVFAMQEGPGAENAFPGIATAYSDSVPLLVLPTAYPRNTAQVFHYFSTSHSYAPITKSIEQVTVPDQVAEVMRRAFSLLKLGRPAPVMVEIPHDVVNEEVGDVAQQYKPVKSTCAGANARDVEEAARVLVQAKNPVIYAGQGVLYAEATPELVELAELLQAPVTTSLEGKSGFPEDHPLALGTGAGCMPRTTFEFLQKADVIFGIGTSLTRYGIVSAALPPGKVIIQATNDEREINKHYVVDYPLLGDAKLILAQFVEAVKDQLGNKSRKGDGTVAGEIEGLRGEWLKEWMPRLTSREVPINPYRVIWEFMNTVDPKEAIVTHDSGSPRNQLGPFYRATLPRSYIGWGKSHALGTGLGLIMGAKLAAPDKFCVHFMGDAAFGMTGLDFETAVRCGIPILSIVLNNRTMAVEIPSMRLAHERYKARDLGGEYAEIGRALGGYAEKIEQPGDITAAIQRGRRATEEGKPALLEFITSEEIAYSRGRPLK
ncbi:MAG: thiamine pyrophosphate-requiring protein [Candidatus Binatia bacterium]